jgi:hypothetical protein
MGLGHAGGYGITYCPLTHRSKGLMALIAGSTTATSMQNHSWLLISIGTRVSPTTIARCSFQNSAADTSSIVPWESWVMWDLLQKLTGSAPTEKSTPASTESRTPSMPSFYKQRQHTPSPSTTLPGPMAPPTSGPKSSVSPFMRWNPALDPALSPLPRFTFPQSPLAKALMTGPIMLTYRARLASRAMARMATAPVTPTASHVVPRETTQTSTVKRYAYGAATNTPPPFVRTHMSHARRTSVTSPSLTQTMD